MNIFYLDTDPDVAAHFHCDKHVLKMIVESAQMLSTACRQVMSDPNPMLYKPTHHFHPCTQWVMQSSANFEWVLELLRCLLNQYDVRYGGIHATTHVYDVLRQELPEYAEWVKCKDFTPPAQAMPDQYKIPSHPVQAYRNYYLAEKRHFARWTAVGKPYWWTE